MKAHKKTASGEMKFYWQAQPIVKGLAKVSLNTIIVGY